MPIVIRARELDYKELNRRIREVIEHGTDEILLEHVNGHRYIGDGISEKVRIQINGTPGNDMAAYMNGAEIVVKGNLQDGAANTMSGGRIVVHGGAGDTLGYALRGGEIYVRDNVGYRVGIHMKGYEEQQPVIVVGGKAGDFFAEYMAGGLQIVLGLNLKEGEDLVGDFCATGMHGGLIYLRGDVPDHKLGKEVRKEALTEEDKKNLERYVREYARLFKKDSEEILAAEFIKLYPYNKRPYGNLYVAY